MANELSLLIRVIIFLSGCLALIFVAGRRNDHFLYLAGFFMPFIGLGFSFFTNIYWALYIFPLALVTIVVQRKRNVTWRDIEGREILFLFLAYVFYITLISAFLDYTASSPRYLKAAAYGWGAAQSTYRYPVQFLSFIFVWGTLFVGFWFVKERRDMLAVIKGYVDANVANAVIGLYQIAAYRWRLPWPSQILDPRGRDLDGLAARMSLQITNSSTTFHRLSGLGGEPKHVASSLVLAIALIVCLKLFSDPDNPNPIRHSGFKMLLMIVALFFTFSSGGWLSLLCVGAYFLVASLLKGKSQVVGYILVVTLVLIAMAQLFGGIQVLQDMYQVRLLNRLSSGIEGLSVYEPKDAAFVQYALDNPLNMILGHGTGGIDFWIMTQDYLVRWVSERSSTVTPAYLPARLLGDVGVVGLVLLGLVGLQWSRTLEKANFLAYRQFLIAGALVLVFASQMSLPGYLLLCGSMITYACRKETPDATLLPARIRSRRGQDAILKI